jgi:superfamily II DNA or RNA helicase
MPVGGLRPRPHQVDALTDITKALAVHDRAQLVMACGAGKTLVGRWYAQAADARRVLVLVPSLALVAQTLREWRRPYGYRFDALVVCSDPTTAEGAAERRATDDGDGGEVDNQTWEETRAKVTTDPHAAELFLTKKTDHVQVVFSTYHSSPVVAAAQAKAGGVFDLAICDEAHRLVGRPRESFATVLDSRAIVARKRLFMTATPRAFEGEGGTSMDDPKVFGPVAHTISFGAAIAAGLLADYQVLVVAGRAGQHVSDERTPSTVPAALIDAVDAHNIKRVLTFHGRVAKAAAFAEAVNGVTSPSGRRIVARHVSGAMPTVRRSENLAWLGDPNAGHVRVVANARCLSEGVDVPAVDGILFADQRSSVVDIIQAVGRVLRPSPGKARGTIILPVTLPPDVDDDSALATTAFAHVWTVLRGLRAHDQRLAGEIDAATRAQAVKQNWWGVRALQRVQFIVPDGISVPDLQLRLVQEVGSLWERNIALLHEWADLNDGALLPRGAKYRDVNLGEWAEQQRIAYRHGILPSDRADRLELVRGWTWDKAETRWDLTLGVLKAFARRHGTVAEAAEGKSVFAGMRDRETPSRHLGVWMAAQRQAYRLGALPARKVAALEELPGWTWDAGLPAVDIQMVEALREFVEFEKHARVPDDHVEDGLRLGAWCWAVRRRKLTGQLAPALEDEILAATPSKWRPAQRFQWEKVETQWRLGYFALRQFAEREGNARPTGKNDEERILGATVNIGQWCALQRFRYRRGDLDERHAKLLEDLPGWQWEIDLQRIPAEEPVALPQGLSHGAAGAYQDYKCRCAECLEYRRALDRSRLAEKRQLRDPVSALRVRRHLERLEADGVSGAPLGVVRAVFNGAPQVEREHAMRLQAVGLSMCLAAQNKTGSRGRLISTANERVDPAPTWQLLDDLRERGFGITWVSRELGYVGGLQITRSRRLSRRIADAVAALHAEVGDLVMPPLSKSDPKPTLAELLRSYRTAAS